jgi:hypothetical protein
MQTLLTVAMFTLASLTFESSAAQITQPSPAEPKISITIKTAQSAVKVGSDVDVEVEMKNISTADVGAGGAMGPPGLTTLFRWEIRDNDGKAVQMTEYGIKANHLEPPPPGPPHIWAGSFFGEALSPGKTLVQKLALSKEYNLSKPGKYTIQALRFDGTIDVKSNTISLTVTP